MNLNAPKKNTLRWHISCDESGIGGAVYYGFGSLWMKWQRRGDFYHDIREILENRNYPGEVKWQKCNDRRKLKAHKELIEYFFKKKWLAFHCIVIRKALVDKSYHRGDYDLARRKHFTLLLTNKIKMCLEAHGRKPAAFRVWVDKLPSRYEKADEEAAVIANNMLAQELSNIKPIESVLTKNSKDALQIQLCDLLLGAVMEAWQGKSISPAKKEIQEYIAMHLGWPNLKADTRPEERKFNIWYFHDRRRGPREAKTREVNLLYHL